MIWMEKQHPAEDTKPTSFWITYSDLMSGLLLVFVLLMVVAMTHYAEFNRKKTEVLKNQEERLKSFRELQIKLIGNLEEAFQDETVSIDTTTGVLQIGSGILFGENESELRPEGQERLTRIFDAYIKVILDDQFSDFIKQIEIEGHTNTNGTYLHNLQLSQQRALTVMRELLDHAGKDHDRLQKLVIAGGRSFSNLIYDENGQEDQIRSRRIEIKFRLKETELFSDIYNDLTK